MDDLPSQSSEGTEVQTLRSEVNELAAVLRLGLAGLFVLTGSVAIYLYRQNVLIGRQVNAQAKIAVEADQKNRAIIGVVTEFQHFGWSHPDYATNVLTRFNLVPLPPTNTPAAEPKR